MVLNKFFLVSAFVFQEIYQQISIPIKREIQWLSNLYIYNLEHKEQTHRLHEKYQGH